NIHGIEIKTTQTGELESVYLPRVVPKNFDRRALWELEADLKKRKLHLNGATDFQRRVWKQLARIPRGKTMTYTQIAAALGQPKAARAVGNACGANPFPIAIPCHRV